VTETVPDTETPSAAPSSTEEIDLAIAVAYVALGVARSAEAHCPSAENAQRVADAVAAVDALLDQRLAAA
jgi:hypothetical protein